MSNEKSKGKNNTKTVKEKIKAHQNEIIDEALKETFPASDPIAPFIKAKRSKI